MSSLEIFFKCPRCGREVSYSVKEKDDEKFSISGISDIAFDHGDHILALFFDKNGSVRAWHVIEKAEPITLEVSQVGWKRVNRDIFYGFKRNFLISDKKSKVFNDIFWKLNPNFILKYIETADKTVRILVDSEEVWVLPLKNYTYVVGGVNLEELRGFIKLLYYADSFKDLINDFTMLKVIMVALEYASLTKVVFDSAIKLLMEIDSKIEVDKTLFKFNVRFSNIKFVKKNDFYITVMETGFPIRNRDLVEKLFEKGVLADFVVNYYRFRELGIVKVV